MVTCGARSRPAPPQLCLVWAGIYDHPPLSPRAPGSSQCWVPDPPGSNEQRERLLLGMSDGEVLLLEVSRGTCGSSSSSSRRNGAGWAGREGRRGVAAGRRAKARKERLGEKCQGWSDQLQGRTGRGKDRKAPGACTAGKAGHGVAAGT